MKKDNNRNFELDRREKAVLDVSMFARKVGYNPSEVNWRLFDGDNYKECREFLKGSYDNTLDYPNIIEDGVVREVNEGDVIVCYNSSYRILEV